MVGVVLIGLRIEPYAGPREDLRRSFELAEDSREQLDAHLGVGTVLVARVGGELAGHVQLVGDEITNVAVAADHRRRGIGRALVEAALALARADGCSAVRVATAAADVDNLRFYQRVGFRMRSIERDAFTPATGYAPGLEVEGIPLRDRVWLDIDV